MNPNRDLSVIERKTLQTRAEIEALPDYWQEETIDLSKYWRVIRKHLWSIIGLSLSVGLLAYLVLMAMTPIYKANSTLIIEPKSQRKVISIEDVTAEAPLGAEYFNTQIQILKSRMLARLVVESLPADLQKALDPPEDEPESVSKDDPGTLGFVWPEWLTDLFKKPEPILPPDLTAPKDPQEIRAERLQRQLSITPARNTYLIEIAAESPNPKLAMTVANQVGAMFIENQAKSHSLAKRQTSQWLADRVEKLRAEMAASEKRLSDYMESQGFVNLNQSRDQSGSASGAASLSASELSDSQTKLLETRKQRVELETVYNQVSSSQRNLPGTIWSIPAIANDPALMALMNQVREAQAKLNLAAERYGAHHPERQAAETALNAARAALQGQLGTVVAVINNQLAAVRANEAALEKLVAQSKSKVQDITRKDSKLSALRQEVETNRNLYELFFNRLKETSETQDLTSDNAYMLDLAVLPEKPAKPKKALGTLIAALLALFGGIGLAFLMEQLDTSLKSSDEVEEKLGLPLIGLVPFVKSAKHREHVQPSYDEEAQTTFSEAIRTVRTGVVFGTLNTPKPVLALTSSAEGEGKTTLVLNLSQAMAQLRRVLIIETDLRKPTIAKRLQFPARSPGLCNFLLQEVPIERCIYHLEPNLDLMPAGRIPPNPLEILSSSRFAELLEQLRDQYEMVILDTPPHGPVSDPLVISQLVDGMILVVRAQKTPVKSARHAIAGLQRVGAPLIGVILNAIEPTAGKYYHYYHAPYGEYRSDEPAD